ncbi:MAG: YfiR family protein [Verrucomicrobia bacterium]|nr:YfiR family protein [Verrucomicrobiota bacterium]
MALLAWEGSADSCLKSASAAPVCARVAAALATDLAGRRARILRAVLLCLWSMVGLSTQSQIAEYDVKAEYLYRFALFVDWPPEAFPGANTPITIGVLGNDPFGKRLDEVVKNEKVHGRELHVERFGRVEEIIRLAAEKNKVCHILFISQSESGKLDNILAGLKGRHILTVGESNRFAERGGIVGFVMKERKVRFKLNMVIATGEKLTISAQLQGVAAELIQEKKDE